MICYEQSSTLISVNPEPAMTATMQLLYTITDRAGTVVRADVAATNADTVVAAIADPDLFFAMTVSHKDDVATFRLGRSVVYRVASRPMPNAAQDADEPLSTCAGCGILIDAPLLDAAGRCSVCRPHPPTPDGPITARDLFSGPLILSRYPASNRVRP